MTVVMILEVIRNREVKKSFASLQVFFDGMGKQFATVITLIVAGEVFANGLVVTGGINALIEGAQGAGLGSTGMIIVMTLIISGTAIIMGSGNAPFFAFAALVPTLAGSMDINPVLMLLPMQFAAGIARSVSPITAAIVSVAGVSNQNKVEVVKRTAIPIVGALIMTLVGTFIINGV